MIRELAVTMLAAVAVTGMTQNPPMEFEHFWWVFLVSGEGGVEFSGEQMQDMQKLHRANLGRLQREKKSVVAGPFDTKGPRRGIVLLRGAAFKDKDAVLAEFKNDPFVQNGVLEVQVFKWMTLKDAIHEVKEGAKMKQYVFVIYNRPKNRPEFDDEFSEKTQAAHIAYNFEMMEKHKLMVAGPFEDGGRMRGILIFDRTDMDEVKKIVGADPWVKAGGLDAEYLTLWAAQGAFGD